MGIDERDYMRRERRPLPFPLGKILLALLGVGIVIAFAIGHGPAPEQSNDIRKGSLRVNVNTATQEELESIPDIGYSRAQAIIAKRPYKTVEELQLKGALGPKLTEKIRRFVKADGETESLSKK